MEVAVVVDRLIGTNRLTQYNRSQLNNNNNN